LKEPLSSHFFYKLVHFVSDRGGARGGAFPSSHVSITTVLWLTAWVRQRPIALWSSPIVAGLIFATVYGRFHYVLDVIAGLALAVAVVWFYKFSLKTPPVLERQK
jgi:membrane-associated phospholipid phosphatase